MLKTHHDLPRATREAMVELLQARLLDAILLGLQAKQAHWNVRGPHFLPLHELFDGVAAHAGAWADLLAERAGALGGLVDGTVARVAAHGALPAYPADLTDGAGHVDHMAGALAAFGAAVRAGISHAEEAGDAGTADALTEVSRAVDQDLWFVESHRPGG